MIRRIFDIAIALLASILMLVPFLMLYIAIKIKGKGRALTFAARIGRREKPIRLYRFDLDALQAAAEEPTSGSNNGKPVEPGLVRFLRTTRLQHLPALLNLLQGDISIIGPDPERPVIVAADDNIMVGDVVRILDLSKQSGAAKVSLLKGGRGAS